MKTITDRISNPFGLVVPDRYAGSTGAEAVYGYGDVNGDFHVIGDRPSVHGGRRTGIPFTETLAGERVQRVLHETGFLEFGPEAGAEPVGDAARTEPMQSTVADIDAGDGVSVDGGTVDEDNPETNPPSSTRADATLDGADTGATDAVRLLPRNLYMSYLFAGTRPEDPSPAAYADLERYFDAELRAVNAHILLPVGATAIDHVLEEYTTQRRRYPDDIDERAVHATEVRGRGFLVVPVREPGAWTTSDEQALVDRLNAIRNRDYRQTKGVATLVG